MPETFAAGDVQSSLAGIRKEASGVLDLLKYSIAGLPDDLIDLAGMVLGRRRQILDSFRPPVGEAAGGGALGQRIRIHGDYRLGKVLQVKTDYSSWISKASLRGPSPSGVRSSLRSRMWPACCGL